MTSRAARLHAPDRFTVELLELREPAADEIRVRLPGHEGWGAIDAIGADVTGFATGERVALVSQHAYAEHDFATTDSVVKLPAELAGRPFPGEPLACAMNILRRSQIEAGQTVAERLGAAAVLGLEDPGRALRDARRQFPLADAAAAFGALVRRPDGFLKACIVCR